VATRRYVKQNSAGSWEVLQEGHRRSAIQADTQAKAVARARAQVRRAGGGEVLVLDRVGKVTRDHRVAKAA
jgi:hypothetical protein